MVSVPAGRGGTEGQLCQSLLGLVTLGEPMWEQRHLGSHLVPPAMPLGRGYPGWCQ